MKFWLSTLRFVALAALVTPMMAVAQDQTPSEEPAPKAPVSVKLLESAKSTHLYTQFDGGEVSSNLTCSFYSSGWMQVEKVLHLSYGAAFGTTIGLPVYYPKWIGLNEKDVKELQALITAATQSEVTSIKKEKKDNVISHVLKAYPATATEDGITIVKEGNTEKQARAHEATDKLLDFVNGHCFWYFY